MSLVNVNASERVVKVTNNGLSVKPADQTKVIKISGTGPQGPAGQTVTPAGAWTAQAYAAYSVVSYQGSSYLSSQATASSDTPGISGKWTLLASKGDTGATGSQGAAGSQGIQGPAGAASTVPGPKGDKGDTGAQGSSGVIAVTAPITNTGTSTSANIGITTGTTSGTVAAGNDSRITGAEQTSNKGQANGYAGLDADGKLSSSTIPAVAITSVFEVATQSAQLALSAQEGDVAVRTDESKSYIKNSGTAGTMADWTLLRTPSDTVLSVNGATGAVTLTYSDVGAAASSHTHTMSAITNAGDSATKNVGTSAGTVAAGDDSRITGAAQKASNLSDLASASTARTNLGLGNSATLNTGTSAGTVAAGNHTHTKSDVGLGNVDNTSDASKPVSTAQQTALDLKAPLASPALTGTPTVPTAAVDTNTTQAASTAFVLAQAASALPQVNGTAAAGTSTRYARADHVHALNTGTTSGTVAAGNDSRITGAIQGSTWDSHAGAYVISPPAAYVGQVFPGSNGTGAQGSCAIRYTPVKDIVVASYSLLCMTAPTSSGSFRMTIYASDGTTTLTASATDGTTKPVAGIGSVTTSSGNTIITGTMTANTGSGSIATITLTAGTTYWIGVFFNTAAATGQYAGLAIPSLFGTTLTTADCWFRSVTASGQTLSGGAVDKIAPLVALKT